MTHDFRKTLRTQASNRARMRRDARVVLVARADDRQCEHQCKVDQDRNAAGEHGNDDEYRTDPFDADARIGRQPLADPEEPLAFLGRGWTRICTDFRGESETRSE